MRRASLLVAASFLTFFAPAGAIAEEEAFPTFEASREPMPFDIIRSLQFLQDQVARGNDRAIRVQALLLRRFGPVFLDTEAEAWQDARNRRAAVLFVLSGGPPAVLAGLLGEGVLPPGQEILFQGALAYVRNDLARAGELLGSLDLSGEESGLAAHIHLVLGQIMQESDPAQAILHLDQARLLAPGGLIEEAALRLETLLVDGQGDHARADRLARQYFDRYQRSSYSANFEARFAAMQAARGVREPDAAIASMDETLADLPDARRARIYLAVGRRALVEGQLALSRLASSRALALERIEPEDRERARLYELASSLGTLAPAIVGEGLASLARDRLHPEDLPLLAAAEKVAGAIDLPAETASVAPLAELPDAALPAETMEPEVSAVSARAERILAESLADLGSAVR